MTLAHRIRSVEDQVAAVRDGFVSARDVAEHHRREITRYEPRLKAWVELTDLDPGENDTADAADIVPADGPLAGLSVGVKDIIDVRGLPSRCGTPTTDPTPKDRDADCVARLRELGAVIQGKTVTTEYGYFSPGPTSNPFDARATPGGSSSGSAAAVGAGTVPFALGTQTAGSLTRPASFCGAAGLVLTHGATSLAGVTGLSGSLDSLGFLAQTVEDLAFVHRAFFADGHADRAEAAEQPDAPDASEPSDLTVFLWEGSGMLNLEGTMVRLLRTLPRLFESLGAQTAPLQWDDHIRTLVDDHRTVMSYEAAHGMGRGLGDTRALLSGQFRQLLDDGDAVEERDVTEALFRRDVSLSSLNRCLGANGLIVGPAAKGPAPDMTTGTGSPELSRPWQLLGLPVLTVPGARTVTGMPLGIQVIGPKGSEPTLLRLGAALEPLLRALPSFSDTDGTPTLKEMKW
ncbi:amidase [Corynebacterium kalidii]|uniref:amidase n=1 Tax=Corynebacterium kalidii TaxID=2931982 RepID=A0A9X2B1U2_9CORY|nr:amidase [Corynebacterium kalidii]MCJ7858434.1 amidase [Corynebacterium kalidii]